MFLGNSRVALGKNFTDPVLGEWKAVAPTEATNGEYGVTGTTDYEVYCLEWVSSFNTLMVGGKFENIISGSEVTLANSIARFDGEWKALTASNISASVTGATSGVRHGSDSSELGVVRAIRDVPMGSGSPTSRFIAIGGNFSRAGIVYKPTTSNLDPPERGEEELNFAVYGLGSPGITGWTYIGTFSSPARTDGEILNFSKPRYTNILRTYAQILFCGNFIQNIQSTVTNFSPYISGFYHNSSTNVYGFLEINSNIDDLISANSAFAPIVAYYGDTGFLSTSKPYYAIDNLANLYKLTYVSPSNYTATEHQDLSPLLTNLPDLENEGHPTRNIIEFLEDDASITRFLSTDPVLVSYNEGNYQLLNSNLKGNNVDTVFYNSGYHIVVGNDDRQELTVFYNLDTENTKPVQFPTNSLGSKVNAVVVDQNTGTIYVGGKFVFRDSDGNTAWNVAKFIPDASKLP